MRQWMLVSGSEEKFNPEEGLVLTSNTAALSTFELGAGNNNAVFAGEIEFPDPISEGILFEIGGSGQGSYLGILSDNTNFIIRAGEGGSDNVTEHPGKAQAIFDVTAFAGKSGTIVWEFIINGTARIWFDGELIASNQSSNQSFESNQYAGGDGGGWGSSSGSQSISGSNSTLNWQGSINSSMRFYQNQNVLGV